MLANTCNFKSKIHSKVHTKSRWLPSIGIFIIITCIVSLESVEAQRVLKSADNGQEAINSAQSPSHSSNQISIPQERFQWNVSSNGANNGINLCGSGSGRPIRVPVYTSSNITTIPCWSTSPKVSPINLSLYKGSSETSHWEDISEKALAYYHDIGIVYNVSGDVPAGSNSTYIGTFACRMDNSDSHVITQLYLDDYFVNVTVSPSSESCDSQYFANYRKHTFWCQVRQDLYENDFQWFFKTADGEEQILNDSFGNRTSYKYGDLFVGQNITFKFPGSNVTGVGCRVRRKNALPGDSLPYNDQSISVLVKDAAMPIIHDASKIENYTDKPGINLTCKYEVEPPNIPLVWYKDGVKMTSGHFHSNTVNRVKTSTVSMLDATYNMTNYTCVLNNDRGTVSKSFLVRREAPVTQRTIILPTETSITLAPGADDDANPRVFKYVAIIVAVVFIFVALFVLAVFVVRRKQEIERRQREEEERRQQEEKEREERRLQEERERRLHEEEERRLKQERLLLEERILQEERRLREEEEKAKIRHLLERDPVISSELTILYPTCKKISEGHYGEVYRGNFVSSDGGTRAAILKMCKWPMSLNARQASLLCQDFMQEIETLQSLHEPDGEGHPNIVRYLGFAAPYKHKYRVYMALEPCDPGDMGDFLRKCVDNRSFWNDTADGVYAHHERIREERIRGGPLVGTSHLMKWAEQLACAMEFISARNLIHRDLAARNMLLAGTPPCRIDDLCAKVSDFGMARRGDHYFPEVDTSVSAGEGKPRSIPARWYAPEALGVDGVYTTKSDVWSFGCLLWEMFNFGLLEPYSDLKLGPIHEVQQNLKRALLDGATLEGNDMIPEQIWELMECCWELDANARPNFADIHRELKHINKDVYFLYENYSEEEEEDEDVINDSDENEIASGEIALQNFSTNPGRGEGYVHMKEMSV